ncbi:Enoyl-[acyl-carrier-protein] reductase [NADH] FabI [Poriferisphaera corsica]|uniref:Enoyl-[acyl-carrier-protein] reductase [NADH] n=1 Tax=Poriferisphaera corsica TaxID=2528020 RepID=A0A517YVV6_9BACT|nr:enoyl-ACP reductase [Poriferisphaera corsica]QDU34361.1 Enoyl-[acyl-carrier-protein] reductase [NADH] FabI [Poriferisphaera corsica]
MGLMSGKRGVIFGVANDRSYAYYIAKQLIEQGAECLFTFLPIGKMEHRVKRTIQKNLGIEEPWMHPCDANSDESLDEVFAKIKEDFGTIDFIVHSIAFADKDYLKFDMFHKTPRSVFTAAMDTSAWTLIGMANRGMELMPNGGSIINLSYYGGERVAPGYNVMGVAKACLEHTTRYLAYELGDKERNIRVNCISAGPFKTLAGAGVGGMDEMIAHQCKRASMKRTNTGDEVGDTAVYLLSDLSTGVTGETIHVDCGFSILGV